MKLLVLSLFVLLSVSAHSQVLSQENPYYDPTFYEGLKSGMRDDLLKILLFEAASKNHEDRGYDRARLFLLGDFYLRDFQDGTYGVKDVYCDKLKVTKDFKKEEGPGPYKLPKGTILNIEHTWPQSKFSHDFDDDLQLADMHHLFPADTRMNAARANLPFGEVQQPTQRLKCAVARVGRSPEGKIVFEPPINHRGNVARALFYFSVRYDLPISDEQENFLRRWHQEDPVDAEEMSRNQRIQEIQGNRNPFIDYPELTDLIADF